MNHIRRVLRVLVLLSFIASASAQDTITYFHPDATGSPVAATDEHGNLLWREDYAPYGERLNQEVSPRSNRIWFTGHHQDDDSGLTYAGARHYDPMIGRFISVDPAAIDPANQFSFSRYAYANNNPYKFVDPDGRLPVLLLVPLALKGIDMAITAYDVHQAYKEGGVRGAAVEVGTNAVMNAVPGGKIGGKIVEAVVKKADDVAGAAARSVGTKGASGDLTTAQGNTYAGNSTRSSSSGGEPRAPMHPQTQEALDSVQNPSGTHGHCCEIDAINKALNAGDDVQGAKMGPVRDNRTGEIKPPCSSCREVKRTLGVE